MKKHYWIKNEKSAGINDSDMNSLKDLEIKSSVHPHEITQATKGVDG